MNEPPPPYSVGKIGLGDEWYLLKDGKRVGAGYPTRAWALSVRDQKNAEWMADWRDRDEADDDE